MKRRWLIGGAVAVPATAFVGGIAYVWPPADFPEAQASYLEALEQLRADPPNYQAAVDLTDRALRIYPHYADARALGEKARAALLAPPAQEVVPAHEPPPTPQPAPAAAPTTAPSPTQTAQEKADARGIADRTRALEAMERIIAGVDELVEYLPQIEAAARAMGAATGSQPVRVAWAVLAAHTKQATALHERNLARCRDFQRTSPVYGQVYGGVITREMLSVNQTIAPDSAPGSDGMRDRLVEDALKGCASTRRYAARLLATIRRYTNVIRGRSLMQGR